MSVQPSKPTGHSNFLDSLSSKFQFRRDAIEERLLPEYGAVLVARGGATPPPSVMFADDFEVNRFQESAGFAGANIGGYEIELQEPALEALLNAVRMAKKAGLSISPRGADSARRSYLDTELLWASRVEPALDHWVKAGRLMAESAAEIRELQPFEQIPRVFELESKGMWFSKDLSKSIIYSVAPPGTSQHLSMLAFDVAEYRNVLVRQILASHGWFQTVLSDLPHFTFIGVVERELPLLGLKEEVYGEQTFWVPRI